MVLVAGIGFLAMDEAGDGFVEYREMARDANLAGRLQANMLMVRMNVKDFIITGDEKDIEHYRAYLGKMHGFLEQAKEEIQKEDRAEKIRFIDGEVREYQEAFEKVIRFREERNRIVHDILDVKGAQMERHLTEIMETAERDRDIEAAFYAGMSLRNLLLGRLYVVKFLDTNLQASADRALSEFATLKKNLTNLDAQIQNAQRKALLQKVEKEDEQYVGGFVRLVSLIHTRNDVVRNTLDRIGPEIAGAAETAAENAGMIAVSAEQMAATINEIAANSERARTLTHSATDQAENSVERIGSLGDAAQEIKGRIEGIQDSTSVAIADINQIPEVIGDVNQLVSTIAAAVEEQSVTTREIASNVAQTSEGIQDIAQRVTESSTVAEKIAMEIADVHRAANEMAGSSAKVNQTSEELSWLAEHLKVMGDRFSV